jgi:hypothetical protein
MNPYAFHALALAVLANWAVAVPTPQGVGQCSPLDAGHGPSPTEDSVSAFQSLEAFKNDATSAITPAGYLKSFSNFNVTYNEPDMFAGYMQFDSYDVSACKYSTSILFMFYRIQWPSYQCDPSTEIP